jgi:hypothetical protein
MLVPFVIDANSLVPDPSWGHIQQSACFENMLDIWQRIGLLAHDGDKCDGSRLYQAIQDLPPKFRNLWLPMLTKYPTLGIPDWNGTVDNKNLKAFATAAQLAIVDDDRAEAEFNLDEEDEELTLPVTPMLDVSIRRIIVASNSCKFKTALIKSASHIEVGDTYQEIWNCRFNTLAKAPIKNITIVDRWAIQQHMLNDNPSILSGLERFLRLIDKSATGPRNLTLYSSWTHLLTKKPRPNTSDPEPKTIKDVEGELREVFQHLGKDKNINRLKIIMVKDFAKPAHDRFVRFGDNYVWDLGKGLTPFEGAYASERSSANFKAGVAVDTYANVTEDLNASPDIETFKIG